jgi:PAS domain-containing protein
MNEPICVARVRKEQTIKVKPGDWIILTTPDGTFADANEAFAKASSPVSEEFSRILVGKIHHTRPAQNPLTNKENEARLSQVAVQDKRVQEIAAGARERMKKIEDEKSSAVKKQHITERQNAQQIAEQVRKATGYKG